MGIFFNSSKINYIIIQLGIRHLYFMQMKLITNHNRDQLSSVTQFNSYVMMIMFLCSLCCLCATIIKDNLLRGQKPSWKGG